jgi:hypothetical protein
LTLLFLWRVLGTVLLKRSGDGEAALRRGDGTAECLGSFDPFLNDDFDAGKSFLAGPPSAAQPGSSGTSAINASSA